MSSSRSSRSSSDEAIGKSIQRMRELASLSQAELSDSMKAQGISWSVSTVSKVERGDRSVKLSELTALALSLNRDPVDFVKVAPIDTIKVARERALTKLSSDRERVKESTKRLEISIEHAMALDLLINLVEDPSARFMTWGATPVHLGGLLPTALRMNVLANARSQLARTMSTEDALELISEALGFEYSEADASRFIQEWLDGILTGDPDACNFEEAQRWLALRSMPEGDAEKESAYTALREKLVTFSRRRQLGEFLAPRLVSEDVPEDIEDRALLTWKKLPSAS